MHDSLLQMCIQSVWYSSMLVLPQSTDDIWNIEKYSKADVEHKI